MTCKCIADTRRQYPEHGAEHVIKKLIINNWFTYYQKEKLNKIISIIDKGLSKSRNLAIKNCTC